MQFRSEAMLGMPGPGSAMPGGVAPAGIPSGFDQGVQAYHPMAGRADRLGANIPSSFTDQFMGHGSSI